MTSIAQAVAVGTGLAVLFGGSSVLVRGIVGAGLLAMLGGATATWAFPEGRPPHPVLIGGSITTTLITGVWFVGVRAWSGLRLLLRSRLIRRELEEGSVERCSGRVLDLPDPRGVRVLLRRAGVEETGRKHTIELLPRSGFILTLDGQLPSRPLFAAMASVAPSASHALRIALPSDLSTIASPTVTLQRRSLTDEERTELRRHARSLRRPPWPLLTTLPAAAAIAAWQWHQRAVDHPVVAIVGLAIYLLTGAAVFQYVQRLRAASNLRGDEALRWLVTVSDRDAAATDAPRLEMLPLSRLAWNEDASPASWRLER